jgi:hypothetical protein
MVAYGVQQEQAATVFNDPLALSIYDEDYTALDYTGQRRQRTTAGGCAHPPGGQPHGSGDTVDFSPARN